MARVREWLKQPYGKKLNKLHAWNAWIVLLLAVSGIVLYVPSIRGMLGEGRVILKQVHIYLGIASVLVILLYVPLLAKHLKQLKGKLNQQWNLGIVFFILFGWSLSGLVLWQFRVLPTSWSNAAVFWHDLFTWVGIPYALFHSVSRSRWLKREDMLERKLAANRKAEETVPFAASAIAGVHSSSAVQPNKPTWQPDQGRFSRRTFFRVGIISVLVLAIGPYFYRWLKRAMDTGGSALSQYDDSSTVNKMLPPPTPLPESVQVVGGGAKGSFRNYTVVANDPVFSSDNWEFVVSGLVETPLKLNWEQFLKIPRKAQVCDFHCVTGWSVLHGTWEGIPLSKLLDMAKVKTTAKNVKFYSGDGVYTDSLTLEQARLDDVLVAVLLDGKPLPQQLGGPVRLLVPQMYTYKSVKWLQAIELIDKDHDGYWEVRGYDTDAWVKRSNKSFFG